MTARCVSGTMPLHDRAEQLHVLARVVLEVRVLDDDDVAGGVPEADGHRRALALIFRLEEDAHAVAAVHLAQDFAGAVGRAVVDDQDLLLDGNGGHLPHDLADRLRLVVDRHASRTGIVRGGKWLARWKVFEVRPD